MFHYFYYQIYHNLQHKALYTRPECLWGGISLAVLKVYLLSQKSHGKGRSSQWRNLMWILRAASVVQVMSQKGHFTWLTGSKTKRIVVAKYDTTQVISNPPQGFLTF